jgi:hypothetical protein
MRGWGVAAFGRSNASLIAMIESDPYLALIDRVHTLIESEPYLA